MIDMRGTPFSMTIPINKPMASEHVVIRLWRNDLYEMVVANPRAFGRIVRRQRKAFGWSQERLAHEMGTTSRSSIQLVEEMRGSPERTTVSKLVNALALTIGDLRAEIAALHDEEVI